MALTCVLSFGLILSSLLFHCSLGARTLITTPALDQPLLFSYHKGHLLTGPISVNLIWYGKFTSSQRAIISDLVVSLSSSSSTSPPTTVPKTGGHNVAAWWNTIDKYYRRIRPMTPPVLTLGKQVLDDSCSLGKSLGEGDLTKLAGRGGQKNAINVVLTAEDVAVEGFCMSRCGSHGASPPSKSKSGSGRFAYIWVGNSARQCPGQCAWPFHQPIYGPQSAPLVAPNGDVGVDGMVINFASMLAGTVTNPFGNGYYQGPKEGAVQLEAATACPGVYGKGAYPGYAGDLLLDPATGASYNANGAHGRRYLLPALYDPSTASCSLLL